MSIYCTEKSWEPLFDILRLLAHKSVEKMFWYHG